MPGWEVLLILLVPVGVWVLSTLLRGEEKQPPRGRTPAGGPHPAQRRPVTDLDRFLEEARRRREAAERRPRDTGTEPPPLPMPRPAPPVAARPAPPPRPIPERRPP